jgi:hypothetical protein
MHTEISNTYIILIGNLIGSLKISAGVSARSMLKPASKEQNKACLVLISRKVGWSSQYSDWLRAGRRRHRSSSPGRIKNLFLSPRHPDSFWGPANLPYNR